MSDLTTMPRSASPDAPANASAGRAKSRSKPRRNGLSWSWVNLLLDAALLVVFMGLCFAAVVVRFVFPPGPVAAGWTLWGLDYDAWGGVQFALVGILAGGILIHVMLHWSWVCNVIASRISGRGSRVDDGLQTIYGVGLLIGLLVSVGAALAAAVLTVKGPA